MAGPGALISVLLVDDDPAVRTICRRILEKEGFRIQEASDGERALELARAAGSDFSLLITDLVLSAGIDGPSLARLLEAEKTDLKTIYVSGFGPEENPDGPQIPSSGRFLRKPFRSEDLLRLVFDALGA